MPNWFFEHCLSCLEHSPFWNCWAFHIILYCFPYLKLPSFLYMVNCLQVLGTFYFISIDWESSCVMCIKTFLDNWFLIYSHKSFVSLKNVTESFISLGHWPSTGSFGVNTDISVTNPINLSMALGVSRFSGKGLCAGSLFKE